MIGLELVTGRSIAIWCEPDAARRCDLIARRWIEDASDVAALLGDDGRAVGRSATDGRQH